MYATGDPDRAPVRCTEPSGYAHTGGEAAFAVLTALWTGHPQRVDLSMQECVDVANMAQPARFDAVRAPRAAARREHRPHPRDLADDGRLGLVRPARRQGAHPEPRDHHQGRRRRRHRRLGARGPGLDRRGPPKHAPDDDAAGGRGSRSASTSRATPCRSSTTSRARRTSCSRRRTRPRDPREQAARRARLLRAARRRRAVPGRVRPGAARATARPTTVTPALPAPELAPAPGTSRRAQHARCRRTTLDARAAGVGRRQHHRVRVGRGRADRDAVLRRARRDGAAHRVARRDPTSCASTALGPDNPHGLEGAPMYDGAQRRQAQRHAQPQAPRARSSS